MEGRAPRLVRLVRWRRVREVAAKDQQLACGKSTVDPPVAQYDPRLRDYRDYARLAQRIATSDSAAIRTRNRIGTVSKSKAASKPHRAAARPPCCPALGRTPASARAIIVQVDNTAAIAFSRSIGSNGRSRSAPRPPTRSVGTQYSCAAGRRLIRAV